jgi:anti-sigma28 factor (negative regulator of flagellin synthesis)
MSYWDDVNPQSVSSAEDKFAEFQVGENEARIKKVEEMNSAKGNPMLVITFENREGAEIKHFIVDGEYKLSKLKQLYIAFGIPVGNRNTASWIGKRGIVVCKEGTPWNGKVYNKVSYLKPLPNTSAPSANTRKQDSPPLPVRDDEDDDIPPPAGDGFEDDIPF